ncbi:TPA: hypothetical protein VBB25_000051 [Streptococcus agalactiae]|uniref:CD20-like domain-containing protein n=1 Tax=Streptococcus agalactiae TaxID=1311 RepID=UPI000A335315|nr:CD20-like domain-containing protein [Streptococcus agalactiae]OTG44998.1 hypothetical protein B7936_05485 [Streptococcus agalactiae]OTG46660.1 hypothetical protein B7935_06010 [Streptococcus agalactiae]OTG51882.1 hypothetical protein B7932_05950 [Streptococcus agalactiae]RRA74065.1 hypothetical protein D5F92_08965 [Streptococcus agalactiae]RRA85196.1 hypothetical protein D5F88_06075 [Streptococcus agalactiae]
MEQSEKKVLAIIAIVIGAIALISSWMPFINNGSFVIAIIALIIGVFALFFNRKRKKTLTYVSIIISILAMIIVLVTQSMYGKVIDTASKSFDKTSKSYETSYSKSSSRAKVKNADAKFKWSESYFNSLVKGQTTYDEVVAKVGKPNSVSDSTDYDIETDAEVPSKDCGWDLNDGSYYANVSIHFIQKNGVLVIDSKSSNGLK